MAMITEDTVRRHLALGESSVRDFKSLWDLSDDTPHPVDRRQVRDAIAEYVAAFANADGGTLLLGVDDDGLPSGHGYPPEAVREFFEVPRRRLRPAVAVTVAEVQIDGCSVLVFDVPMSAVAVMVEGDGFPYRAGDSVLREPQEVINERKQSYRRVGFEARFHPVATIADLDLDLARSFLSRAPRAAASVEESLVRYGLIETRGEEWAISNAALLLFGRSPSVRWHPRAGLRVFRVDGIERMHGARRNVAQIATVDPPLALAIPRALEAIGRQIGRSEKLHDLFFKEIPEYPAFAWQEGIVNAVAHRDYADAGREIEVWFFNDRLEIESPGEPVAPVTIEAIRERRRVHASRNPRIVRVLADVAIMRDEGEGIPRIFEEMHGAYLRDPEFEAQDGTFRLRLRNTPIFEGPSQEWHRLVASLVISDQQRRALLAYPQGFTNEQYRHLNQVDRDVAYRDMQDLVLHGALVPAESSGRGAIWRVSAELLTSRAFLESRASRLRTYFAERDVLRNADYRTLFNVSRNVAFVELRRLVELGLLDLRGQRRAARYRPGSALHVGDHAS